jgi:unsaturated rhamnogalacturonyl hydrolase
MIALAWLYPLALLSAFLPPAHAVTARQVADTIETIYPDGRGKVWNYDEGTMLDGMDDLYDRTADPRDLAYIRHCVDRFLTPEGIIRGYKPEDETLDNILMARQLLFLYRATGEHRYLDAAAPFYQQLQHQPRTPEGGFWHKKRYPNQMWLDGIYMAEPFYAEYSQLTNQKNQADIALQFSLIEAHARDPHTGLLLHAWDASPAGHKERWADPVTGKSPTVWTRAMGWYGMALVDTLDYLPVDSTAHSQLLAQLRRFATAVAATQDPASGLWFQVPDHPTAPGNYLESSGSAMFAYTLAKGVGKGWLAPRYTTVADKATQGLVTTFVTYDATGLLHLGGTADAVGLGGSPTYRDGTLAYYLGVKQLTDDARGLGALLLALNEKETPHRTKVTPIKPTTTP